MAMVRMLLDGGADVNVVDKNGMAALHCASDEDVVRLLEVAK